MEFRRSVPFLLALALLSVPVSAQYVEATLTVGTAPVAMVYDSTDHKVFVANDGSNNVSVINADNNTVVATVTAGEHPAAICWNRTDNRVYVANAPYSGGGSVTVINASTNEVVTTIDIDPNPSAMCWNSQLNKVYVSCRGSANVVAINCGNNQVVATIHLPSQTPNDIVYNPTSGRVYVSSAAMGQSGRVRVIDCDVDTIAGQVTAGYDAWALAVNPVSNRVYCANRGSGSVTVINAANNSVMRSITTRNEPTPLLWAPTNRLFCGGYWDSTVWFMHGDSLGWRGRIKTNGNPKALVYVPGTQKVFNSNPLSGTVTALDVRPGHEDVVTDIPVGAGPSVMVVYPEQDRVFVANSWDSTVTVIKDVVGVGEGAGLPVRLPAVRAVPNPAARGVAVEFAGQGFRPERLRVRDADGRLVHDGPAAAWRPQAAGVYFCGFGAGAAIADCRVVVR